MTEEAMSEALDAIYEEAERLSRLDLPTDVSEGLALIMSIARYKHDVRSCNGCSTRGDLLN